MPAVRKRLAFFEWVTAASVLPIYVGAVGRYGQKVLAMLLLSILAGAIVEGFANYFREDAFPKRSWLIWLIFPLALPAGVPLWLVPIGLIFGLVFAAHLFGGFGRNLFPIVAVGVVFLALSYPTAFNITTKPFSEPSFGFSQWASQIPLARTVFADLRKFSDIPVSDFLFGRIPGAVGESYAVYLIILGLALVATGFLDWRFACSAIAGAAFFSWLLRQWFPEKVLMPHYQLLAGSFLLYITVFVPSDPFSLPRTYEGRLIGGFIFSFFTVMLRSFSGFAEGVWFSALLTSVFSSLVDQTVGERIYGSRQARPNSTNSKTHNN